MAGCNRQIDVGCRLPQIDVSYQIKSFSCTGQNVSDEPTQKS